MIDIREKTAIFSLLLLNSNSLRLHINVPIQRKTSKRLLATAENWKYVIPVVFVKTGKGM